MLYSKRRKNLRGEGRKRSNRKSYSLKHINSALTKINQKGGGEYFFKSDNSTQVEKILTLLKKYDGTSSAKLINITDTFYYYHIHPNDINSMRTLLEKSYPNAIIDNNPAQTFTVSGENLKPLGLLDIFMAAPTSNNLKSSANTTYLYIITTNDISKINEYLTNETERETGRSIYSKKMLL